MDIETLYLPFTLTHRFIVFVGGPEKNDGYGKRLHTGALYKTRFVQEPHKLDDASGKTIYPGMIDRGFTAYIFM
jgi:hypothetical protein